jgi:hypothetical protein
MMRTVFPRLAPRAAWLLAAILLAGCRLTGFYLDNPANPMTGVKRIAVLPISGPGTSDPLKLGEILAGELVQFPGVEVIHPAEVQAEARKCGITVADERAVRALGRVVGADAILIAELTEYTPYYPQRVAVAAQLFFTRSPAGDVRSAVDLSAAGRARPVARLDRCDLIQLEKVYDGSQRETRDWAARYARGHSLGEEAIDGADRVLRLPEFYFRFVSNRLVRDIFSDYQARVALAKEGTGA